MKRQPGRKAPSRKNKGLFLSFEGGEGAGKSTQIELLAEALRCRGHDVKITREPGGSEIANRIRSMILDPSMKGLVSLAELFLYEASRAQHVADTILPALKNNQVVICDRFTDSSVVYQGAARGLDAKLVIGLNKIATSGVMPKRTFVLDIDPKLGLKRVNDRGSKLDRMETEGLKFHQAVRMGYLRLARKDKKRIRLINAAQAPDKVHADLLQALEGIL